MLNILSIKSVGILGYGAMDKESFYTIPDELKSAWCCLKCQQINAKYKTKYVTGAEGNVFYFKRCKTCDSLLYSFAKTKDLANLPILLGVGSLLCLIIDLCIVLEGYYKNPKQLFLLNLGIITLFLVVFLNNFYYYIKTKTLLLNHLKTAICD